MKSRITVKLLAASTLWFTVLCSGQNSEPSADFNTGRMWARLSHSEKLMYLTGFVSAAGLWKSENERHAVKGDDSWISKFPLDFTLGEVVESVNRFYIEPTNRRIPLFMALTWVQLKSGGTSDAKLKEYEAKLRSGLAK
jgi:hypothetical protein